MVAGRGGGRCHAVDGVVGSHRRGVGHVVDGCGVVASLSLSPSDDSGGEEGSSSSSPGGWGEWWSWWWWWSSVDAGGRVVAVVVEDGQSEGLKEIS